MESGDEEDDDSGSDIEDLVNDRDQNSSSTSHDSRSTIV